jgi:hypothetical protein
VLGLVCGADHAPQQHQVLAVLCVGQLADYLAPAAAGRQRGQGVLRQTVIRQAHPASRLIRRVRMSALMVWRIWPIRRMRSGQ